MVRTQNSGEWLQAAAAVFLTAFTPEKWHRTCKTLHQKRFLVEDGRFPAISAKNQTERDPIVPIFRLENVSKSYRSDFLRKKKPVLRGVDLQLASGETLAYLGHNGAGKTTTIKALLGLIRVDEGKAEVFSHRAGDPKALARLGYLPENPYFYDHLSGREFLQLVADLHRMPRRDGRRRVEEVFELVGMTANAHRRLRTYSKGMLQRMGLAQALVNDPELLILDEPMGGLDPVGRHQIRSVLNGLKKRGKTIFMSSHILSDVESLADRVAILDGGRLKRVLDMRELDGTGMKKVVQCRHLSTEGEQRLREGGYEVRMSGGVARIEVENDRDLPSVLQMVQAEGAAILKVEPLRSSLEEIFLQEIGMTQVNDELRQLQSSSPMQEATDELVEAVRDVQEVH